MFTHSSLDYAKPLLREYLYTTWDDLLFHWKFRKARSPSTYQIPSWICYYKQLQIRLPAARNLIGYLDFLDALTTDMVTMYHLMERALRIYDQLEKDKLACVYDRAIFAKAIGI